MDKSVLRDLILGRLEEELNNLTRAARMAHDEATHEESKPQNKYDTHSQEAAYLAESQAKLAAELRDSINMYRGLALPRFTESQAIALGAYIVTRTGNTVHRYFLGPRNGGMDICCGSEEVTVITPQSPVGRLLLGRKVNELVVQKVPPRNVEVRIVSVE